ncbi:MAG: thioredoxin domain-containing protein [bacterium]|nr:thioredoxin domain-containing protein [bacterium]
MSNTNSQISNSGLIRFLPFLGLALAVLALGLSIALACKHEGLCTGGTGCLIGDVDGCAELGKSEHSKFAGIHIAWLGVFYYAMIALLFGGLIARARSAGDDAKQSGGLLTLLVAAVVFGFVFDLFLAYVNFTVLEVPCLFCLYTYLCQAGILAVAGFLYYRANQSEGAAGLGDLLAGLKGGWWAPVGALSITLLTVIALPGFAGGDEHAGHNHGGSVDQTIHNQLASPERREQLLRELRAFNQRPISTAGLTNYEGEDSAFIILHKWADFRCPHCLHAHELIRTAQQRWPGRIKVYYRHFPLDSTCNPLVGRDGGGFSCNGSQAALCAPQNIFGDFYHGVFQFQNSRIAISPDQLRRLNETLGGNWSAMVNCMGSAATQRKLLRDINEAEAINVQSTPTLVLEGHVLPPGTPRPEFFLGVMDALVIEKEGDAAIQDFQLRRGTPQP